MMRLRHKKGHSCGKRYPLTFSVDGIGQPVLCAKRDSRRCHRWSVGRPHAVASDRARSRHQRSIRCAEPIKSRGVQVQAQASLVQCVVSRDHLRSVERAFTIALPGSVEALLGPGLLAHLQHHAPNVRVTFRAFDYATVLDQLDTYVIDFAVSVVKDGRSHHKIRQLLRAGTKVIQPQSTICGWSVLFTTRTYRIKKAAAWRPSTFQ